MFRSLNDAKKTLEIAINNMVFVIKPGSFDVSDRDDITLSILQIEPNDQQEDGYQSASSIYAFNLTTSKDGITSKIKFKIPIEILLGYDAKNVTDPQKLGVYYYHQDLEQWQYVGGRVDTKNKQILFEAEHFSQYTVMEYSKTFEDIQIPWAKYEIEILAARHVAKGTGDNFLPNNRITRAEFSALLVIERSNVTWPYELPFMILGTFVVVSSLITLSI